jgi:hypothetical protein
VRALLAESSKYLNAKDEIAELRLRLETVEREKAEFQQKLSESGNEIGKCWGICGVHKYIILDTKGLC